MYFGFNNCIIKNVSYRLPSPNNFLSSSNPFISQFLTPFSSSSHSSLPIFTNIFPSSFLPFSPSFCPFSSTSILFLLTIHFLLLLTLSSSFYLFSHKSHTSFSVPISISPSCHLFSPINTHLLLSLQPFLSQSSTLPYFTHFSPTPIVSLLSSNSFSHFQRTSPPAPSPLAPSSLPAPFSTPTPPSSSHFSIPVPFPSHPIPTSFFLLFQFPLARPFPF